MSKDKQRKAAAAARRDLSPEERRQYSAEICRKILELPVISSGSTVFSYLASWDEVDMALLNKALADRGITVAYPVCLEKGYMEAYVPASEDAVITGAYGIKAPDPSRSRMILPEELDLVIVPLVAFDAERNRCGHGAGYYDRYLPRCGEILCIAPAFEAQRLETVATDEHDRKMDIIVTELAVYG